jgi:hypothetical protein
MVDGKHQMFSHHRQDATDAQVASAPHIKSGICPLPFAISHLPFAICHLPFAICPLSFVAGWLLAALGAAFAPWVDRAPAALMLTAPDLAEFVKFLPEVRAGQLVVQRLWFLAPLFAVTFGLPFVISSSRMAFPAVARRLLLAALIPLALTLLPPVWSPAVLLADEFRLQTLACGACLGLVIVSRWLRLLPFGPVAVGLSGLWVASSILALWQFHTAQAAVARAYASPIAPGWGVWTTCVGCGLMMVGCALAAKKPKNPVWARTGLA